MKLSLRFLEHDFFPMKTLQSLCNSHPTTLQPYHPTINVYIIINSFDYMSESLLQNQKRILNSTERTFLLIDDMSSMFASIIHYNSMSTKIFTHFIILTIYFFDILSSLKFIYYCYSFFL